MAGLRKRRCGKGALVFAGPVLYVTFFPFFAFLAAFFAFLSLAAKSVFSVTFLPLPESVPAPLLSAPLPPLALVILPALALVALEGDRRMPGLGGVIFLIALAGLPVAGIAILFSVAVLFAASVASVGGAAVPNAFVMSDQR